MRVATRLAISRSASLKAPQLNSPAYVSWTRNENGLEWEMHWTTLSSAGTTCRAISRLAFGTVAEDSVRMCEQLEVFQNKLKGHVSL